MELANSILSDIIVHMKYSRYLPEKKRRETWEELVTRNMNMHLKKFPFLEDEIRKAYELVYEKKVLPSMRGLQFSGKPIEISPNRFFNCSYCPIDDYRVFSEIMFLLLGGSGVGYSVQKSHVEKLPSIRRPIKRRRRFLVGDSIEGWADAIHILMRAYFEGTSIPVFDYSDIREKGSRLITSGGRAPGPQPLKDCIHHIKKILDTKNDGDKLSAVEVHDIVCLHHDTQVMVSNGEWKKIGHIVKNREEVEVISFNERTGLYEPKKVIGRYKNNYPKSDWMRLNFEHVRYGKHGPLGGWFTHDHSFLTKDGYKEIQELTSNDYVNIGEYALDNVSEQLVYGSLLGDGSLVKQGTAYFTVSHTEKQHDYLDYKFRILSNRGLASKKFYQDRTTYISNREYSSRIHTVRSKSIYSLSEVYKNSHTRGKKKVNKVWLSKINALGLSFWYMDDGSYSKKKDRPNGHVTFSTYNMQIEEVELLVEMLRKFDIFSVIDVIDNEKYSQIFYRIRLNVENSLKFFELIKNYVPPCMEYKLPDKFRGYFNLDIEKYERVPLYLRVMFVERMSKENTRRYKTSYCIDVEENHNFMTRSGIVHNCFIADAVLSGGIRRASLIALFSLDDEEMLTCKFGSWWERNPQRGRANNSAVVVRHRVKKKDFLSLWKKVELSGNGEPGISFTNDKELGVNPCHEASLKPFSMCNLTEINVSNVIGQEDLNKRAKAAAFIGTLQSSYTNFHFLRDIWKRTVEKEALLGVGMTGICSSQVSLCDITEAANIVVEENARVAELIGINKAARCTVIKPSGTSSLVVGCSSGIHAWHSKFYIRRIRVGKNEAIYHYIKAKVPELVEDDFFKPSLQAVFSFPQKAPGTAILRDEGPLDLLERVKKFYNGWILPGHRKGSNTHNVSCTVSIAEDQWDEVGNWMWKNRDCYNGLSVLPFSGGSYHQSPFEECSESTYRRMLKKLTDIDLTCISEEDDNTDLQGELACSSGSCELVL